MHLRFFVASGVLLAACSAAHAGPVAVLSSTSVAPAGSDDVKSTTVHLGEKLQDAMKFRPSVSTRGTTSVPRVRFKSCSQDGCQSDVGRQTSRRQLSLSGKEVHP